MATVMPLARIRGKEFSAPHARSSGFHELQPGLSTSPGPFCPGSSSAQENAGLVLGLACSDSYTRMREAVGTMGRVAPLFLGWSRGTNEGRTGSVPAWPARRFSVATTKQQDSKHQDDRATHTAHEPHCPSGAGRSLFTRTFLLRQSGGLQQVDQPGRDVPRSGAQS